MNVGERNYVYREIQRLNAGWSNDEYYDDKPGLPDIPLFVRDLFELCMGDELERVEFPNNDVASFKEPEDWYKQLTLLFAYVVSHVNLNDRFETMVMNMIETTLCMMRREFGFEEESDDDYH